jgi:F-type H+-transporting ATPase subunit delta
LQFLEKYWYDNLNLFRFYLLLSLLIQNDRIIILDKIVQKSLLLSYKKKSFVIAKITSSVELSWRQKRSIYQHLKGMYGIKKIKLALKTDLNLIGGYKIEVGSTLIDKSIRHRLNKINSLLGTLKFY